MKSCNTCKRFSQTTNRTSYHDNKRIYLSIYRTINIYIYSSIVRRCTFQHRISRDLKSFRRNHSARPSFDDLFLFGRLTFVLIRRGKIMISLLILSFVMYLRFTIPSHRFDIFIVSFVKFLSIFNMN
jgi:hypothetical protein